MFEGEAAALAATQVTDEELAEIAALIEAIAREENDPEGTEQADRAFHLAIACATRNTAIHYSIERLWGLRATSPDAGLLHEMSRIANIKPAVDEHAAIFEALHARDPAAARVAMRSRLTRVIDSLLFASEVRQIEEARKAVQAKRPRYSRATA